MNVNCPFCNYNVEVDVSWARKNGKIFCGTCCKSFEVKVPEESAYNFPWREAPKKEVIPEPVKEEVPEPVKNEPIPEEKEPDKYDSEDFGVFWDSMDYGKL